MNCELNTKVPEELLSNYYNQYAEKHHLESKLNGRHLELNISNAPVEFVYTEKEDIIFLIFYAVTIYHQSINADGTLLAINYKLVKDSTVIKQRNINLNIAEAPYYNNTSSVRKITRKYLERYKFNLKSLADQCMDKIMLDIE